MRKLFPILVFVCAVVFFADPSFATQSSAYTSQYIKYRAQANNRTDPRLKHLPNSSPKSNKCLQYTMGICTLTEPPNYGRLRFDNAHRKQDPLKKMGFQGPEYWSN